MRKLTWLREQPEWLYEALPYVYVASGIATILVLRNEMAVFSGLMLVSAGTIVWLMRTASRRRAREVPRHAKDRSTPIARPGFLEIAWRREYEVGHPRIDAQHRGLFATANALLDVISTNQSQQDVQRLLDRTKRAF